MSNVTGLSLIMKTNEEVEQAADLLRTIGLQVTGEDGYVETVVGPSITLSIMRGAMVEVPRHGGVLIQIRVVDVAAATDAVRLTGVTIAQEPTATGPGIYSAVVQSPAGFTLELQTSTPGAAQ